MYWRAGFRFHHPVKWVYLGEAAAVLSHDVGVGAFQFPDDLKALIELGEDVNNRAGEQSMLGGLLELKWCRVGKGNNTNIHNAKLVSIFILPCRVEKYLHTLHPYVDSGHVCKHSCIHFSFCSLFLLFFVRILHRREQHMEAQFSYSIFFVSFKGSMHKLH